jgi:hypothetical protein
MALRAAEDDEARATLDGGGNSTHFAVGAPPKGSPKRFTQIFLFRSLYLFYNRQRDQDPAPAG